ncbi:MAG: MaoC family dehydratase N-terminal domain-containing protein [Deltaproteobacteria bacterium]|nr:MaoC family dehydratase N-terminal domain-containing protein [Deltaproteobacteria bacterium]MBW2414964.1 MaoC family dehydratase N-terminal domain-containing protein [Deltaproteobacteria bacterium]
MPVPSSRVGKSGARVESRVDARWLMAYAAGLGDDKPCYLDTTAAEGIVAHPLFPVCFEWPIFLSPQALPGGESILPDEVIRGVHATHDLVLHRPIRADETLATTATVVGVERRPPGAYQVVRFDTQDAAGEPVCTTWYGTIYRGVGVEGPDHSPTDVPPGDRVGEGAVPTQKIPVEVSALAAHVYTECARIWNPIHTDVAVAERAGLPGIILHGTATLALAVSRVVEEECGGDPTRVRRVTGRFGAMVPMPSTIEVRILERRGESVFFEVRNAEGDLAVRDGRIVA